MEISEAYKFCPVCGGPFSGNREDLLVCGNGHPMYINQRPTVSAIILNDKREILLTYRDIEPKKDFWDLPGGFVGLGESLEQALARELEEELNIKADTEKYFGTFPGKYLFEEINYPVLDCMFFARIISGKLSAGDDVNSYRYFPLSELPDNIAFETHRTALELLNRHA